MVAGNTPEVLPKVLMDINLNGGVNERDRTELIDWTKYFKVAENVSLTDVGAIIKRPGTKFLADNTDDGGVAVYPNYRLLPQAEGLAMIGNSFQLYELSEREPRFFKKNRCPEFTTNSFRDVASGSVESSTGCIFGVAVSDRYRLVAYDSSLATPGGIVTPRVSVVCCDLSSGNIVRTWTLDADCLAAAMVVVNSRYLHIFAQTNAAVAARFYQVDLGTTTLTASGTLAATTTFGAAAINDIVAAVSKTGSSAVLYMTGGNTFIAVFTTGGTLAATSAALAGIVTATDMDTDGTSYFVAGINGTPNPVLLTVNGALAITRTCTSAIAGTALTAASRVRIGVSTAGDTYLVLYNRVQSAFVAGVYYPGLEVITATSAAVVFTKQFVNRLNGWAEGCKPFYSSITGRWYVGLLKQMSGNSGAAVDRDTTLAGAYCIVDITEYGDGQSQGIRRPAAVIDEYTASITSAHPEYGYGNNLGLATHAPVPRPVFYNSSYSVLVPESHRSSSANYGIRLHELGLNDPSAISSATDVMCGGRGSVYDGNRVQEIGWVETPTVFAAIGAAGGVNAGIHSYVAVFEFTDSFGRVHWSRCSRVSQVTPGVASLIDLEVPTVSVTDHISSGLRGSVRIFRTAVGGTSFYEVTQGVGSLFDSSGTLHFRDDTTDTTLISSTPLYRDPGVSNTALDRFHAISSRHVVRHKDRVFYCHGSNVYYSSFFVDGEAPWFNPAFSFSIPGGTGDITALATIDGVLVVFKRDGVWLIDGDGPPENGGTGTEFSPPRRINTEYGCIEPRSLVYSPDGVMYQSDRGIEQLSRSFAVDWIGEMVSATLKLNPHVHGSAHDLRNSKVLFVCSASTTAGGIADNSGNGVTLVYDLTSKAWTIHRHKGTGHSSGGLAMTDVAYVRLYTTADTTDKPRVVYSTSSLDVVYEVTDNWKDRDNLSSQYISMLLETGYIRTDSLQERARISDFLILAKKLTDHDLKVYIAYDYSESYTLVKTFAAVDIAALTIEQLNTQAPQQAHMAVSFRVTDTAPADAEGFPSGTGRGPEILALTPRLGKRGGGAKLSSGAKG